jgi:glycosyltransferase involved in cell wall biosynthesis
MSVERFTLLAVGRLQPVKDHAFLVQACAQLAARSVPVECLIAGEGPERSSLESLIRSFGLERSVRLLGHVPRDQMSDAYDHANLVVLTSRSEGIPLVLMEAMARGKIVLAPAITGIPELVVAGHTGFLYEPGSLDSLVDRLLFIYALMRAESGADELSSCVRSAARQLRWMRHAAQVQVQHKFNREKNLQTFADQFLDRATPRRENIADENFVLQQI